MTDHPRRSTLCPLLTSAILLLISAVSAAQGDERSPWLSWETDEDWSDDVIPRNGGTTTIWKALHLWKERPAGSQDEASWEERIERAHWQLCGVPGTARFRRARTRWAQLLMPVLLGGVSRDKADFPTRLTVPCDEIRSADEAASRGEATEPVGWDVQLVHALALSRCGFVGDAARELDALTTKVAANMNDAAASRGKVEFLGEARTLRDIRGHLDLFRAMVDSLRTETAGEEERTDESTATKEVRPPDVTPSSIRFLAEQGEKASDAVPFDPSLKDVPDRADLLQAHANYLALFEVDGNRFVAKAVRDDEAADLGVACWKRITTLFPPLYRRELVQFNIHGGRGAAGSFSGSGSNDVGRVGYRLSIAKYCAEEDRGVRDSGRAVTRRRGTLDWTLVHEMGHYICLRSHAIELFTREFDLRDDAPKRREKPDDYPADGSPRLDGDFVTSYAERAAVDEEVCETFTTYLVVARLPTDDSLAARKIRFFEKIPGLPELRKHIQSIGAD